MILTRKGITSSPTTGIDATSVVDVPVVASLKLEKRNFGGDVLASTSTPPFDAYRLVRPQLSSLILPLDFYFNSFPIVHLHLTSEPVSRLGLTPSQVYTLLLHFFSGILRIQLEQTPARASYLPPPSTTSICLSTFEFDMQP